MLSDPGGTDVCATDLQFTINEVSPVRIGATHYLEVSFPTTSADLAPSSSTGDIQLRLHKCDWTAWNDADDYSYIPDTTTFIPTTTTTAYQNGALL